MQIEDRPVKPRMSPQMQAFLAPPEPQAAPGDLWRAHGIWAPGVRLMRNVSFQVKALIIGALFLGPVLVAGWSYLGAQQDQIAFGSKERLGVQYAQKLNPLLPQLRLVRKLQAQWAASGKEPAELAEARSAVTKQLAEISEIERTLGAQMGTAKSFLDLKAAIEKLPAGSAGTDAGAVIKLYTEPIDKMLALLGKVLDDSNLLLDPDLDTYYLMDAALVRLPDLTGTVARMSVRTAAIANGAAATPQDSRALGADKALADYLGAGLQVSVGKVVGLHPEMERKIALDAGVAPMRSLHDKTDALLAGTEPKPTATEMLSLGDAALQGMYASQATMVQALDVLLEARISGMQQAMALRIGAILAFLALAGYFFYSFFLVSRGGLELISRHLQEMASGDLRNPPAKPLGSDEPAAVILDLRVAYNALYELIRKVRHSARALHTAAGEISAASNDLGGRTEAAAASLEEQASAMEEIGSTVEATSQRAMQAATFAVENAVVAEKGGAVFGEVVVTMREIHASSSQIGDIIGVIDGIAFQTNILALNAAVEAARAGEAGRGFAVVAAEVRTLAQRSAGAAREIKTLISASVGRVEGGTRVVEAAGQTMAQVVTNAKQINGFLAEIATAAKEQALGVSEVGRAIQELDKTTQQNAALVEETNAAAGALTAQADELQADIANFRVV